MLWGCTSDVSKETGHDGVFPVARIAKFGVTYIKI